VTDAATGRAAVDPHRPALTVAAALLGAALQRANGFYEPVAMTMVVAALLLAWAALLAPHWLDRMVPDRPRIVAGLLAVVLLGQLAVIARAPIGMYFARPMPWQHPGFVPGLAVAGLAAAMAALGGRRLRLAAAAGLLGTTVLLGLLTYRGSPEPVIDVVTVHDEAFAALARGESPYSMSFPDLYEGRQSFYPPGMVEGGRVLYGFPYPPLSLVMAWPGHRLGDFRYAELAALVLGAAALVAAGRAGAVAVLAAGVLLFTPRGFFALEQSWTEPFAILWLGLAVWAASARRPLLAAVALGLGMATKQYLVLAAPMLWHLADQPGTRRRVLIVAAMAAALATLPALADPQGFLHSAVMVQVREVLRMDALSLAVPLAQASGAPLPGAAYAALVVAAALLATWRAPSTPSGAAAALAVTVFTAFAFGKKAFCNYYVLVIAALVLAIGARRAERDGAGTPTTPA
jgi:hypothetical protein